MLLAVLFIAKLLISIAECSDVNGKPVKPYSFPVPFEFPNRNDRADQCWLRIEDVEVTETMAVYCTISRSFLNSYIRDYNSKKMTEDGVDVSLWSEQPLTREDEVYNKPAETSSIKDWKVTTVMDPITRMRLYVTKNADCRLIMYSREGMTNYIVDCEKILYYINDHMSNCGVFPQTQTFLMAVCFYFIYLYS